MLDQDPEQFYRKFRMTPQTFNEVLARLSPRLQKQPQVGYLPPGERLAVDPVVSLTTTTTSANINFEVEFTKFVPPANES
jgi:hypothetical protein